MCHIKRFIEIQKKKKQAQEKNQIFDGVFKESLESLFDKPEYVKKYFAEFLAYAEKFYEKLLLENKKVDEKLINELTEDLAKKDKSSKYFYYRSSFLIEFLVLKI